MNFLVFLIFSSDKRIKEKKKPLYFSLSKIIVWWQGNDIIESIRRVFGFYLSFFPIYSFYLYAIV